MYTSMSDCAGGADAAKKWEGTSPRTGVGSLLRAWRSAAGTRSGRPVLQEDVAEALHKSVRWYRDVEADKLKRPLTRQECSTLGTVLGLDAAQRRTLFLASFLASTGGPPCETEPDEPAQRGAQLRHLLDRQLPSPAYVVDPTWTIVAVNASMADLFPWSAQPGANLMRWFLLSPESRKQHLNWPADALVCLRMLRTTAVTRPHDDVLRHLVSDVCQDPLVHNLWTTSAGDLADHHDGHLLRLALPARQDHITELVTHVLHPAGLPDHRMTILMQR